MVAEPVLLGELVDFGALVAQIDDGFIARNVLPLYVGFVVP